MSTPEAMPRGSRETRLLLVTIAVSVGVLLLLARFRFPDEASTQTVPSAPAPLERLAARAVYDELASTMADLERRILPRIATVRLRDAQGESVVLAPRLTPDRAVALMETVAPVAAAPEFEVIGHDPARSLVVIRVPAVDDGAVTIRQGAPRVGPRYVAVVEASPAGPIVRPLYVARVELRNDAAGRPMQMFSGLEEPLAKGSAIFTLEGAFLGLVRDAGRSATVVPAETLPAAILNAQPAKAQPPATLGVEVNELTPPLARATGAEHGVVVVRVLADGPAVEALQSGDVIQAVDGTRVTSVETFRQAERARAVGSTVSISGMRRRKPMEISVTAAAARTTPTATADDPGFVGRTVAGAGIEVIAVDERGAAASAGLSRGDLIVGIDGEPARDVTLLTRRFRAAERGEAMLLTIQRNEQHLVLALEKR